MAVAYQSSARYTSATGQTSYSPTHNLQTAAGNERMVVVCVNWEDDAVATLSSITLGGNAPDGSDSIVAGSGYSAMAYLAWWYDDNLPASAGNTTIAITASASIVRDIMVNVAEFTGVSQTETVNTNTAARTSAGNISTSVTVDADDSLGVGTFTCGSTTYGSPTNMTSRQAASGNSSASGLGSNENVDGSSITLGWTSMSTRGAFVGAVFQPEPESSSSSSSLSSSSSSSLSSSSSSFSVASNSYVPRFELEDEGGGGIEIIDMTTVPTENKQDYCIWLTGGPCVDGQPSSNSPTCKRFLRDIKKLLEVEQHDIQKYCSSEVNWMNWYRWIIEGGDEPTPEDDL